MASKGLRRGRKPSIAVATAQVVDLGRTVRTLATDLRRLQSRLRFLDAYYSAQIKSAALTSRTSRPSRRGPNVRDLAHNVLQKSRKALPIRELAVKVTRARGGKAGKQFAQNLGIAIGKDRRFKRVERGVYGLR